MNIIVLGCGRVGSTFARLMYHDHHRVTVIDLQNEAFRRLGTRFKGERIIGNGIDEDVLRKAGIENCDVFVAATKAITATLWPPRSLRWSLKCPPSSRESTTPSVPTAIARWALSPSAPQPSFRGCCATL